jgi:hypothetical protein
MAPAVWACQANGELSASRMTRAKVKDSWGGGGVGGSARLRRPSGGLLGDNLGGLRRSLQHLGLSLSWRLGVSDRRCGAEPGGRGVAAMVALSLRADHPQQLGHLLCRVEPGQGLAGPAVEPRGDLIQRGLVMDGQVGAFGQVLAQQPVGVLV